MAFEVADVLEILGVLDGAGVEVVITGGWGVDALLGEQSRPHADMRALYERLGLSRSVRRHYDVSSVVG